MFLGLLQLLLERRAVLVVASPSGLGPPAINKELVVAHAQREDALVELETRRVEFEILDTVEVREYTRGLRKRWITNGHVFASHLDGKLLVVKGDVADLGPRKPDARRDPARRFAEVKNMHIYIEKNRDQGDAHLLLLS